MLRKLWKKFLLIKILKVTRKFAREITDVEIWRKQNTVKLNSSLKVLHSKRLQLPNFQGNSCYLPNKHKLSSCSSRLQGT